MNIDRRPPPRRERPLVTAVLPVYNEAEVLGRLVSELVATFDRCRCDYEIVFVNDGSSDASGRVLDDLSDDNPRIRVLHLSRNFGHQAAVQAGLAHASGDAVVLMDADLQDLPAAISQFLDAWREGADVVYAVRTDRKEGRLKRTLFDGFYRLLNAISSTRIPLDAGNFSLMDRRVVRRIVELAEHDRYLPGLRSWVGFRQQGIAVARGARYDARPRVSMLALWRLAKTAIFSFSAFPLVVFYVIGYSALAIFAVLGSYSVYCKLFTELAIPGWTSHILSASFFGALNALGISILGEYVIRIYDQVRGRPIYLVDRAVNVQRYAQQPAITAFAPQLAATTNVTDSPAEPLAVVSGGIDIEADPAAEQLLAEASSLLTSVSLVTAPRDPDSPSGRGAIETTLGET